MGVAMKLRPNYLQLAKDGDLNGAIKALELESGSWAPKDYLRPIQLGELFMVAGEFAKAADNFALSQEMIELTPLSGKLMVSESLGAALWLAGQRSHAIICWQRKVDAIRLRKIAYADISGGIKVALLLFYGAVSMKDEVLLVEVKKFLNYAGMRSAAENMPGPLAKVVLGNDSIESVLKNCLGFSNVETSIEASQNDTLLSRQLAPLILCIGAVHRQLGDEKTARIWFARIENVKNSWIEPEWYLAKRESELSK